MTTTIDSTRAGLREFSTRYRYDTGYMERLLGMAPAAYERFAAAMGMSQAGESLPVDARFVAKAATLLGDDCGPCLQLTLQMAVEAGVRRELLGALLDRPDELPPPLRDVYRHARQVVAGENGDGERIERLRAAFGDQGFGEICVLIAGARLYPTIKRAMGAASSCHRASLQF